MSYPQRSQPGGWPTDDWPIYPPRRRRRWRTAGLLLTVLVVAGLAGFAWWAMPS